MQQLVEKLYRLSWTRLDGLGALVLTPTRELALQIFEELVKVRVVGARHKPWHRVAVQVPLLSMPQK